MKYIITKGRYYIKYDYAKHITLTTHFNLAEQFDYNKAKNILSNSIKQKDRKLYKIEPVNEKATTKTTATKSETVTVETYSDNNTILKDLRKGCLDVDYSNLCNIITNLKPYKDELTTNLQEVNLKLNDIRHRIEFPKSNGKEFNAFEMFKLVTLQREILRKRRNVKNDIRRIDVLLKAINQDYVEKELNSQLEKINNQTYTPRVLNELFAL